ncbi:Mitochondrial substrate carrier family protein L [Cyphellophora attinorum]|uniref:Mitochondrial substrate carrier family protein L n=1 Tax=Cyphellophora attinorum TaxID=1664694 RepID=A0A0N0NNG7_9EURO|nr:Mitochondrial substrate carrier family protein L [Phialophora attinorum]KPI41508.1 Mitochondrial substrate carrier family protein L [Phialophora attinorum]
MAALQLELANGHAETRKPLVPDDVRGFMAGAFSGFAKCTVGHPFDTIKVRMQTCASGQFHGPLDCLMRTVRNEGVSAIYKGVTPPLVGWLAMDSVMLGSLTFYRKVLRDNIPCNSFLHREEAHGVTLHSVGHGLAGMMAGGTVCVIATPVEHIKARLQIQYAASKADRFYHGPINCLRKIYKSHGLRGIYHGFPATLVFRSFFFFWWGSYDLFSRLMHQKTSLSTPAVNFWAGGMSAQVFWIVAYPSDVVKQRIMTDPLGGCLNDGVRRFPKWKDAARAVYQDFGIRGYWRGFIPCFLRAFPANACALLAFESVMRGLS